MGLGSLVSLKVEIDFEVTCREAAHPWRGPLEDSTHLFNLFKAPNVPPTLTSLFKEVVHIHIVVLFRMAR
jgi:hypothetical protein